MFPSFLHPFIVRFLPSWYRIHHNLRAAKKLISPIVRDYVKAKAAGRPDTDDKTLLLWMVDSASTASERDPEKLAHRQLLLSLGSIHTTTMATAHAFYDLCAHPEYFAPLREEIEEVLTADGGWTKQTLTKMRKLESFMTESQRINPPSLCKRNPTLPLFF
jgi:cytochrome P450